MSAMNHRLTSGLLCIFLYLGAPALLGAEEPAAEPERPCLGYDPVRGLWEGIGDGGVLAAACPPDHAVFSVVHPFGSEKKPTDRPLYASCCPLPPGILSGETVVAEERCPEGSVVIGQSIERLKTVGTSSYRLLCGVLGQSYALGVTELGSEVSTEQKHLGEIIDRARGTQPRRIPWTRTPVGFRYAIGRRGRIRWSYPSCISFPFEGVLVGRSGKRCFEHQFARIVDRTSGQPVKLFPACDRVSDPLDPSATCIRH